MQKKPYVIVFGNEKGGTGKSTVAMHVLTWLMHENNVVGSIDVDARQGTLTRYVENRRNRAQNLKEDLKLPEHTALNRSLLPNQGEAEAEDQENLAKTLQNLQSCDYIVIDTPGSDNFLSRLAHSHADMLITPLNDSFVDLDMLVRVTPDSLNILRPSTYAEMVWEQKKQRAIRDGGSIDWIVLRNRLSNIFSRNKEEMGKVLRALSKRIGFRLIDGFSERVVFREMFLSGLTLLDAKPSQKSGEKSNAKNNQSGLNLSHIAAKQELANLINVIQLPHQKFSTKVG